MRTKLVVAIALAAGLTGPPAGADNPDGKTRAAAKAAPVAEPDLEATAQALTLAEVVAVAVRQAPELEHAKLEVGVAHGAATAAEGPQDLRIVASAALTRVRGAPFENQDGITRADTASASIGLAKLLPTNGTLALLGDVQKLEFDDDPASVTSGVSLRLTQPLLRSFGPWVYAKEVRVTGHRRDALSLRRRAIARDFTARLSEAYWTLALAWAALDIRRTTFALGKKQLIATQGAVKTGKIARSELLPLETAMATREQDILGAEVDVVRASLELRKLAGLEVSGEQLVIKTEALPALDGEELGELAAYVDEALAHSDELRASDHELRAARAQLDGDDTELLPRLDLTVEAGPLGTATDFKRSVGAVDDGGYGVSARVDFGFPLGRSLAHGTHDANRSAVADAAFTVRERRANLAADVAELVYTAKADLLRAGLGVKAVASAEAEVVAEQAKFEVGKTTNTEIVRRQSELEQIKLRQATAISEYLIVRARLAAATDHILQPFGITIPEKFSMKELDAAKR